MAKSGEADADTEKMTMFFVDRRQVVTSGGKWRQVEWQAGADTEKNVLTGDKW